ncbi:GTPase ObgE [Patescibacteria group bacterium]|nr:GTPase ObgE [Patescibacteria group bacterium]MBU1501111.1 GTPase ObgE [Patescibacteria group bacterium]MBU2081016.1 GTPase ObgE [Patescibacteria group bacterium]MBU2124107.1 GTPase ObgE [Patescibacteria group bacterium]MBU2194963.1 GTPase ObgE [Patescibacteria group bacterium]
MAFIDEMKVHAVAGKGGSGVERWLHLKGKEKGGPAGGDGGRGGDIFLEGVRDLAVLSSYRYTKTFRAENGGAGEGKNKHGKDGEPVIIKVPVGTVAHVSGHPDPYEVMAEGQRILLLKGGIGGYGNAHFKGATNQNPTQKTEGKMGQSGDIHITLKLIADAGLIGFPNAGKSSLLNALTRAQSKIGAYPFTTLDPHLGDFYGYILADIPGLIEGASEGRGLGSRFLKHIERTGFLVHLVSAEQEDVVSAYRAIRDELTAYDPILAEKPELVVLSKVDMLEEDARKSAEKALSEAAGKGVVSLSLMDEDLLKSFSDRLSKELAAVSK